MKEDEGRRHGDGGTEDGRGPTLARRLFVDSSTLGLALVLWLCSLVILVVVLRVWLGLGLGVTAVGAALALLAILLLCFALQANRRAGQA